MLAKRSDSPTVAVREIGHRRVAWMRDADGTSSEAAPGDHRTARRKAVLFEVCLATIAYISYFLVRGITESGFAQATDNAELVIRFEKWLGFYREDAIQDAMAHHDWLVNLANWVYIWGHWPVIVAVGAWLLWASPREYRKLRNGFLISGAIGLVVFAMFPVAPPRLLEIGLIDTVTERSLSYRLLQPPAFVNQYAAMPSLHIGWDLLVGITLVRHAHSRFVRVIGVLLPIAMAWAVVATANHFLIDSLAGAALAIFGLVVATRASRQLDSLQERTQSFVANALTGNRRGAT